MRKSISSMYFSTTAALLIVSTAVLCAIIAAVGFLLTL